MLLLHACFEHSEAHQEEGVHTPSFVSNSLAKLGEEDWDEGMIQEVAGAVFLGEQSCAS